MSGIASRGAALGTPALRASSPGRLSLAGLALIVAAPAIAAIGVWEGGWSDTTAAAVALAPMWAVIAIQVLSVQRALGVWLAVFTAFTLPQVGHFGEHVGQMVQIHRLDAAPPKAHGAVGTLDIEWVHFLWNGGVLMGVLMLVLRFRRNPWLWVTLGVAAWHMAEHIAIMVDFWSTGKAGDPGLLAKNGAIAGGTSLLRPDLHFLYNLAMTTPLVIALVHQLKRCREDSPLTNSKA